MPKLPTPYGERPTPGFGRPLKVGPQVEPVDNGYQQLAAGFKGLADEIEKVQLRNDKSDTTAAITRLKETYIDQRAGEGGWLHDKEGAVGETWFTDNHNRFTEARNSIGSTLASKRAKKMYEEEAGTFDLVVQSNLLEHATGERAARNTRNYKDSIEANINMSKASWANQGTIKKLLIDQKKTTEDRLDDLGVKDQESIDLAHLKASSGIHLQVIKSAVDDNSSGYAEKWLESDLAKDAMTEEDRQTAKDLIKKGNLAEQSQAISEEIKAEGLTLNESLAKARRENSGELEDHIVSRLKVLFGEGDAALKQSESDASDEAYTIYNAALDGESSNYDDFDAQLTTQSLTPQQAFDLIPQSVRERMNPKELSAMRRMVEIRSQSQSVHTQYSWWEYLTGVAGTDIDAFRNINLREYVDRISTADLKTLREAQTDELKLASASTKQGVVAGTAENIYGKNATNKQKEEVRQRINEEVAKETAARQAGSGPFKELTTADFQEIGSDLTLEFKRKQPWYWPDSTIKAYAAEIEGVPATIVDELVKGIGGRGVEVYEAEIIAQYNKFADVIARSNGDPTEENILKLIRMRYGDGMILPEIPPNERNTAPSTQSRRPTAPIPDPYKPSVPR